MAARKKDSTPKAANIHVITGSDDGQVREAALATARQHQPPDSGDFGLEIIDGTAENADHAERICGQTLEALQTLPMSLFGPGGKVVWLRNASFLDDSVTAGAEATLRGTERLMQELETGLPADIHFVLSAPKIDKRRSFYLRLDKIASIRIFDALDTRKAGWESEVESMVLDRCESHGLSFAPAALPLFVMLAGERTAQIVSELEKLDLYLGPERREVTVDDVRAMVPLSREGVVFELGNAIGSRDARRALSLLDQLLAQGENAVGILMAAIIPKIRNLVIARDMVERHRLPTGQYDYKKFTGALEQLPEAETSHIPKKKDGSGFNAYPLFLAAQEGSRFSAEELRRGLRACLKANHRLVTSGLDARVALSQLLIELLIPAAEAKKTAVAAA